MIDMKALAVLAFVAAAIPAAQLVTAAGGSDRPSQVLESDWIPISERFGFVIDPDSNESPTPPALPLPAELMPPVKGYFVVKTDAGWRRLAVVNPVELARL